jgi:polyisoprenoid-binding protein YceI
MSETASTNITWNLDTSHTSLEFAVRHMAISNVRGRLKATGGHVVTATDGSLLSVEAALDASSIETGEAQRDGHLRSADFLESAVHPSLNFKSSSIKQLGANSYRLSGDLTIRGQTKAVVLEVETVAAIKDPYGMMRIAATAHGKLSRKEWGLVWNQVLEMGSLLVGDEVKFTIDVEAVRPAA